LDKEVLDSLRIEKIGKYYALRLGNFKDKARAEELLKSVQHQLPSALIRKAYFIDERIIRRYTRHEQEDEERISEKDQLKETVSEDVSQKVIKPDDKKIDELIEEQKTPEQQEPQKDMEPQEEMALQEEKQIIEQAPLYSAGPWTGIVIDARTKKPIEGAVVAAIWYREYTTRFTRLIDFHEAKEVLTDSNGYFEIAEYKETGENKQDWRKPQIQGPEGPIELFIRGPVINDPQFIIHKPGFQYFPKNHELMIFATRPFHVEYPEFYRSSVSGEKVILHENKFKDFRGGLVYEGLGCLPLIMKLGKKAKFRSHAILLNVDNSEADIRNLNIPLDCPKGGELIPEFESGYKYTLSNPFKTGGFILIELSQAGTEEDVEIVPEEPHKVPYDRLPILYGYIKQGKKLQKNRLKKK
jgi:hypothetical protein